MNNRNVKPISPFIVFCQKVIPLAFDESMSYYECLCALTNYLYNEVIPAVNNNADAVTELQNYVENYFDNLDVQEEINNKLDEMAESGQLTDIIAQYLQLAGVLAYDTKNDMKNASNLTNGSICKTLGDDNYNDGKGNFYKVRTITSGDTVDDDNIVALTVSNTLIAEKIPYSNGYSLQSQITTNTNAIADLNNNRSILLSDSYFDWSPDVTIPDDQKYWKMFFKMENITNYQGFNMGGIGFYQKVDNVNFLKLLQNNSDNIPNKETVKNIFVFGGYNDAFDDNTTITNIKDAIKDFVTYCKTTYPNAKVIIGEIGYDTNLNYAGTTRRNKINNKVVPAYCDTNYDTDNSFIYLPNLEYCLHNRDYMSSDGIHPNIAGHNALANAIHSAYHNGFEQLPVNEEYVGALPADNNTQENTNITLYVKNDMPLKTIRLNNFAVSYTSNYPTLSENIGIVVGKITNSKTIIPVYDIPFDCTVLAQKSGDNTYEVVPGKLMFTIDGSITLNVMKLNSSKTNWDTIPDVKVIQVFPQELACSMNVL